MTWTAVSPLCGVFSGYLILAMLLIVIIDSRVFLIPDVLSLPSIPMGWLASVLLSGRAVEDIIWDNGWATIIAVASFYAIRFFYQRLRGAEGLGLGDVKLAGVTGAWLGTEALVTTLLIATIGALVAVFLKRSWRKQQMDLQEKVPFGSFIALAILVIWFGSILHGHVV
jgi:leader peptidase (prepilin peptidase)/N-methyltransferase